MNKSKTKLFVSMVIQITFSYIEQVLHLQMLVNMLFEQMQPFLTYYALVETFEFYHRHLYMLSYLQTALGHNVVPNMIR